MFTSTPQKASGIVLTFNTMDIRLNDILIIYEQKTIFFFSYLLCINWSFLYLRAIKQV